MGHDDKVNHRQKTVGLVTGATMVRLMETRRKKEDREFPFAQALMFYPPIKITKKCKAL